MARHTEESRTAERLIEKEIAESVIRAKRALNKYVDIRTQIAQRGENPEAYDETYNALRVVHETTLDAFKYLSEYIEDDLPEYWNTKVVGKDREDRPIVLGNRPIPEIGSDGSVRNAEEIEGVRYLNDFYGQIERRREVRHQEFGGSVESVTYEPVLLSFEVYEEVLRVLFKVMKEAEMAPQTPTKVYHGGPDDVLTHEDA